MRRLGRCAREAGQREGCARGGSEAEALTRLLGSRRSPPAGRGQIEPDDQSDGGLRDLGVDGPRFCLTKRPRASSCTEPPVREVRLPFY